jgi:hypothetical protein
MCRGAARPFRADTIAYGALSYHVFHLIPALDILNLAAVTFTPPVSAAPSSQASYYCARPTTGVPGALRLKYLHSAPEIGV